MSSTILHNPGNSPGLDASHESDCAAAKAVSAVPQSDARNPFLAALGERVRSLRSRRGMTRKAAALVAGVSERHLANLEYGVGNASILVLLDVARALQCSLAELIGDITTSSPEWLLLRELLERRDDATLRQVRVAVGARRWQKHLGPTAGR
jgi:XRE family transcriptional regulator, aerobic/anaerobic benzoate catabolism transcriptional regulator